MLKILGLFIAICALTHSLNAQSTCSTLGDLQTFLDPSCNQGGAGCNAGGQGQNCRFCGLENIQMPGDHIMVCKRIVEKFHNPKNKKNIVRSDFLGTWSRSFADSSRH